MMSAGSETQIDQSNLIVNPSKSPLQQKCSRNILDDDTVFKNLYCSAFFKAVNISRDSTQQLGDFSASEENDDASDSLHINEESSLFSIIPQSSTPKKNSTQNYLSNNKLIRKSKHEEKNMDLISEETKNDKEIKFSYQKFLHESDVQRRLTVDAVMKERIQNMYDIEKLIRDSFEHLKQTRIEEMNARKLFLESKILSDIQEQEILNRPKREAQWAKDNLKEAQRIQERNQKVKEAEEEVRKKSEAILLKRKLIDKILFELQKEYNKKYKSMLESIKLCKDKTALTEIIFNQTKIVKECAIVYENLLKKCKQGDVYEQDVESAKAIVDKITSISETISQEITKINDKLETSKLENEKKEAAAKNEAEQITITTSSKLNESSSEANNLKKFPFTKNGFTNGNFENSENVKGPPTIALKRKFPKLSYYPTKKKAVVVDDTDGECSFYRTKKKVKNKTPGTSGGNKQKRNFLSYEPEDDLMMKGDIQRQKVKSVIRRKCKRVRFSDLNEIIGCNYSVPLNDINANVFDTEESKNMLKNEKGAFNAVDTLKMNKQLHNYLSDCFDARSLQVYLNLKTNLENFEKGIEPLLSDESMKKFRFNCQKAVTIPVNAISPISASHLTDKYLKLHNLLSGRTVEVGDIKISASQHPLGVAFCKNLLAKKFVRQGDLTVSSKPDAAFSIAAVLASLWADFPDFGQLVLAHFHTACPYLVPLFMPQVEGQSDEEYYKSLGYNYSSNGEVEKQDSFLKRMSGIMRLYSALLISKVRQPSKVNPLGLQEGWRWISALLNLEPRPDICATLLYDFLEVAGHEMLKVYDIQFKKMLAYICQEYFPKLEKVTPSSAGGPIVRLEGFLQKILKEESIPPPNGVLPTNFW